MQTVLLHDNYGINEKGNFTVCGHDTVELAKEYGTPLYVLDEDKVRRMCRMYITEVGKHFDKFKVFFASKALCFKEIYRIVDSEGIYADTVSGGEVYTALSAGFPAEKIHFHGNNKTYDEIEFAIKNDIGGFVADNIPELDMIDEISAKYGKKTNVVLRVTPGVDPHTHVKIATGLVDSKFGLSIETGQAFEFVKHALTKENLNLEGIHCHVGSQSFDPKPFLDSADIMLEFIAELKEKLGYKTAVLNLGGGFGVRYLPEQKNLDAGMMLSRIGERVKEKCKELQIDVPEMHFEPGRSIVAAAGVTLYTVGSVKTIPGYKSYIPVDGGMGDNPRYALYEAPYYSLIANKATQDMSFKADITGKCCESGDLIQPDFTIQKPEAGDILAVCVTGAYNYSMASNYNRLPRPALVIVNKEGSRLGIRRETYEDLVRNDV